MFKHSRLRLAARRAVAAGCLSLAAFVAMPASPASAATTVHFCGYTMYGTYGGYDGKCSRQASFSLNWIAITLPNGNSAECVYRGSNNAYSPPMPYGEYCSSAGQTYLYQGFYGNYGNPAVHNRHSYDVPADPHYNRN